MDIVYALTKTSVISNEKLIQFTLGSEIDHISHIALSIKKIPQVLSVKKNH